MKEICASVAECDERDRPPYLVSCMWAQDTLHRGERSNRVCTPELCLGSSGQYGQSQGGYGSQQSAGYGAPPGMCILSVRRQVPTTCSTVRGTNGHTAKGAG